MSYSATHFFPRSPLLLAVRLGAVDVDARVFVQIVHILPVGLPLGNGLLGLVSW